MTTKAEKEAVKAAKEAEKEAGTADAADTVNSTGYTVDTNTAAKAPTEREALFAEYIGNYKVKNPVKWASKNARGEFNVIPDSFQGKKRVRHLANGGVKVEIY